MQSIYMYVCMYVNISMLKDTIVDGLLSEIVVFIFSFFFFTKQLLFHSIQILSIKLFLTVFLDLKVT